MRPSTRFFLSERRSRVGGRACSLARISHTLAAHPANHLDARAFVIPHQINLDMPWSQPLATKALCNLKPECEICGLDQK